MTTFREQVAAALLAIQPHGHLHDGRGYALRKMATIWEMADDFIALGRGKVCDECAGWGHAENTPTVPCNSCAGKGFCEAPKESSK